LMVQLRFIFVLLSRSTAHCDRFVRACIPAVKQRRSFDRRR